MATFSESSAVSCITVISISTMLLFRLVVSQPALNSDEQEAVYRVLDSINSEIQWRSLFTDDFCTSELHGIVCDYFKDDSAATETVHITELSFGYVSDYSPNPPCTPNSTIDPFLLSSFRNLRKLFFYKCFTGTQVPLPNYSSLGLFSLEELVFIENPSLFGSLSENINNLTALKRLVLTGTNVSGKIPDGLGELTSLEQVSLSRNKFNGVFSVSFSKLKKLRVLDLSQNEFEGIVPELFGGLTELLKLDLSLNRFSGKIPESLKSLKNLEFMDLSYNLFTNSGVPLFLSEMTRLKEVYLSGNFLGGQIPEIWEQLEGIVAMGLSGTGLVGNIPSSMGVYLRKVCYLGLDNNRLEGTVPEEIGALEFVNELNLENNNLSGRVPFSAKFVSKVGEKLKLEGNPQLCVDEGLRSAKVSGSLGQLKLCNKPNVPKSVMFYGSSSIIQASQMLVPLGLFLVSIVSLSFSL